MSEAEIDAVLACPRLMPREREVVALRYREHVRTHIIAQRLGIAVSTVTSALSAARRRALEQPVASKDGRNRYGGAPLDDAWLSRNVAMIQRAAGDEEHQQRYLHGIELLWGAEMRARLARAAGVDE